MIPPPPPLPSALCVVHVIPLPLPMPSALFVWYIYPYPHPCCNTVWYISYPYPHPCLLHCLCGTYDIPTPTHAVTLCGTYHTPTPTLAVTLCGKYDTPLWYPHPHPCLLRCLCTLLAQLVCDPQLVWECVHVYVCVCVDGMNLKCALRWHVHISSFCTLPVYTHTCILIPFEDCELTELKVDIAPPPPPPFWLDRNFVLHAPFWMVPKNALWKPALLPLVRITFIGADSDELDPKVTGYSDSDELDPKVTGYSDSDELDPKVRGYSEEK